MNEPDWLDVLLRESKAPEPSAALDERVISAYRSAIPSLHFFPEVWRQFCMARVSVPAPALVATALVLLTLFFWLRPSTTPAPPLGNGVVTRLNATGFQPLPNGDARVVQAAEVRK
jgi:hypothetical protein